MSQNVSSKLIIFMFYVFKFMSLQYKEMLKCALTLEFIQTDTVRFFKWCSVCQILVSVLNVYLNLAYVVPLLKCTRDAFAKSVCAKISTCMPKESWS